MSFGQAELLLIPAILSIFVVPFWRIFSKAGYPGWLGIGIFFPPPQSPLGPLSRFR